MPNVCLRCAVMVCVRYGNIGMFLLCHLYVFGMVKHTKHILFQCVTEVCFRYFKNGMFWVSLGYVNYVPKMMLYDIFWVFQRYLRQTSDKALTYLLYLCQM